MKLNPLLYERELHSATLGRQRILPCGESLGLVIPIHSRRKRLRRFPRATAVSGIQR